MKYSLPPQAPSLQCNKESLRGASYVILRLPVVSFIMVCTYITIMIHEKVQVITAVPLNHHDDTDSCYIEAQWPQLNRPGHKQSDTSSRTERSGDPGSRDFNDLLDTG